MFGAMGSAWCAGPILTAGQIQAAIQEGRKYKSADKFIDNGLKGRRVDVTGNTNVIFFNDWQEVALESAAAHQQLRELNADQAQGTGLLHAYVEIVAAETWTFRQGNTNFLHSHLVLSIGDRVIQPLKDPVVVKNDQTNQFGVGKEWVITLAYDFDVSPGDLLAPVTVIAISGDGKKHQKKVDLSGVFDVPK